MPTLTTGYVAPAEDMIESNAGTVHEGLGESTIAKQPHYIKNGQEFLKDGEDHSLYDFTTADITNECKDICEKTQGCDRYHHVYLNRKGKCRKCGECVLRKIFYESIPDNCKDVYNHQRFTAEPKFSFCDLL